MSTENPHTEVAFSDMDREFAVTRSLLERVPVEKASWKPHEKSTSLERLAFHLANLPSMVTNIFTGSELDMATRPRTTPPKLESTDQLLSVFDKHVADARTTMKNVKDADLPAQWTLKNGEHVIFSLPRSAVLRTFAISHSIHHRAQLGVYLRMLDVALPEVYGPTADTMPRA